MRREGDSGELADRLRLRLLTELGEDRGDTEVLLAALQQVTAELRGLGAMVHFGGRRSGLHLTVSTGLPRTFARYWGDISDAGAAAPARAFRDGGFVWLPTVEEPEQLGEAPPGEPFSVLEGVGIAAVVLPGRGGPQGALSVLTPPDGEPGPAQRAFLDAVAGWLGKRLRLDAPKSEGLPSALQEEPERLRVALRAASVMPWDFDVDTGRFALDERIAKEYDLDMSKILSVEGWNEILHPDDRPHVWHEWNQAIASGTLYDVEFRARRKDGAWVWLRSRGTRVLDDKGEPYRMIGAVSDSTETHLALESVGRALRHMTDGFLSVTAEWRIDFVNDAAERLLAFPEGLVGRSLWEVPAVLGLPGFKRKARSAMATEKPGGLETRWPGTDRWYHLRLLPVAGSLTVYITDATEKRLREMEQEAAAGRAAFVAQVTRRLSEAVSAQDVVTAVADSLLPAFGAAGLIILALEDGRLNVVGSAGYPSDFRDRVHGMPVDSDAPVSRVLRTRTPQFVASPQEYTDRFPESSDLLAVSGKAAWAFLPLIVSGRPIGCAVISFDQPREFAEDERTLLTALSGQIAQAVERASLYDEATTRARELQRGLLPRALPALPAVTSAARFMPAGAGTEVGGDWYDVLRLSADRVALVVGDVMGHGMSEAATMGRLRTAVRTLSDLELPPDDILAHLNDLVTDLGEDYFATCLYGVYDPVTGDFTYASAGHPPPALVHPDDTVTYLAYEPSPPLGAALPPFTTTTTALSDGSILALYTDGLVESPARDMDQGMAHLARTLQTQPTDDLEILCDTVTRALLPPDRPVTDDAALLIARTHRIPQRNVAVWPLPDDPRAASQARDHIRTQLRTWDLDELETTTELIASELVGNVVRHAPGPMKLRLLRSHTLICEVSDASLTTPHIRHPSVTDEGGRGLQLVAAMTQRWGTRHTDRGKTIWTEQLIPE